MKRPRAPIACFRCHRKKVRCDGAHPFCTRCQSTGSSCSYPSSRRSRNTQPHHVDPYIDHLSQLEHQIRQIEADMNEYRSMLLSTLMTTSMDPALGNSTTATASTGNGNGQHQSHPQEDMLRSHLSKTEQEVQESRTILAQLRLRGEQRIARTKRNQTKEAKQQQQRQQQQQQQQQQPQQQQHPHQHQHQHHHHHRSSSSSTINSINDKKKTMAVASSSSSSSRTTATSRLRKDESATSTSAANEAPSSSSSSSSSSPASYLGIREPSSATKSANQKQPAGIKSSYLPSSSSSSSATTIQHVSSSFLSMNSAHIDSMDLYGQTQTPHFQSSPSPSTSYHHLYPPLHHHHSHQHTSSGGYPMPPPPPPTQQQSADLYYMTMVGAGGGTNTGSVGPNTAATTAYYDPLMDYPWTTPTDFAATATTNNNNNNNNTDTTHQDMKVETTTCTSSSTTTPAPAPAPVTITTSEETITPEHRESAHYSPSTVAAIEQVTRMAQQMNHPAHSHHQ